MRRAIVSVIATGDALVSYWPIFSLSQQTVPEVFAKVNLAQFPTRLLSGEFWRTICRIQFFFWHVLQGYDMEDAMILNKASFERGFAHGTVLKCEVLYCAFY